MFLNFFSSVEVKRGNQRTSESIVSTRFNILIVTNSSDGLTDTLQIDASLIEATKFSNMLKIIQPNTDVLMNSTNDLEILGLAQTSIPN